MCVDGPAGSGKTTLRRAADRCARRPDAGLVHLEDLYAGWTLTGAVARLSAGRAPSAGRGAHPAPTPRYDWHAGRFAGEPVAVPVPAVLVVEGCGSSPRRLDPWTTLRVWVEAPAPLRLARGLARDGDDLAAHWRRWQASEAGQFAAEDTRARADLRVDGAAAAARRRHSVRSPD